MALQSKTSPTQWHALDATQVAHLLQSNPLGLSTAEASSRLAQYGPNLLPEKPPESYFRLFLRQFYSPLIYILGVAALVSLVIGDFKDAAFIVGVLTTNALIGSFQEWKAEQSSFALRKLLQIRASVLRDNSIQEVGAEKLVPGDVVWLESGNRIPADIRLLLAQGVEVDESLLTGESLPVQKNADWVGPPETPISDRLNMVLAGSILTRGRAQGMVVATGIRTTAGELAVDLLSRTGGQPPLVVRMEQFTRAMSLVMLVATALVFTVGVGFGGYRVSEMFLFAVALAVSAIPEGLPVAMTVALAVATTRMAQRGLIVRRLTAVEGLGSCTLIATDKTGTLTCNELTVREICLPDGTTFQVTGEGFRPVGQVLVEEKPIQGQDHQSLHDLTRASVQCNEASLQLQQGEWTSRGDAVDIAMLALAHKLGMSQQSQLANDSRIDRIPFEPERRFAASFHQASDQVSVFVKGAPEQVLEMCTHASQTDFDRQTFEVMAVRMAARGYRVIALADGQLSRHVVSEGGPDVPENLRFLGFVGMIDPLRPGTQLAIQKCHQAGVQVSMITGDHRVTALAIARDLGLASSEEEVLTGSELAKIDPSQLPAIVSRIRVFARVAPGQKTQIVEAARTAGHFVAVTGDGVNDAPALSAANIGVAMGKSGTDVAREAAELVISDDNFATIVSGIEEGRVAYDNIRKVIYMVISTGAAEIVVMALAIATGTPYLPLLPIQLLWLNLVTNGIQDIALAFEPNEGHVLERKPRSPDDSIFDRLMIERTILAAVIMGGAGFATFLWFVPENPVQADIQRARNALLLLLVLFENIHMGNCRSETLSAFSLSPLRSPVLLTGTSLALLLHVLFMYWPFGQHLLETQPISLAEWGLLLLVALSIVPALELHKFSWKRRFPETT